MRYVKRRAPRWVGFKLKDESVLARRPWDERLEMWLARWLLYRIGEEFEISATLYPKPVKGQTPIRYRNVISVLKNPFYIGLMRRKGTLIEGTQQPLFVRGPGGAGDHDEMTVGGQAPGPE